MVAHNDAPLGTAFTVSVDVRHGLTTGISAEERTNTVRALANGNMGAADFVRPGHVFPLVAKEGGVLMRSGHTEACVDLCRLAAVPPVGVLAELMNDDGTVMRGPEIAAFATRHKLARVSIADLIAYRQARERLIERVGEFPVESEIGTLVRLCLSARRLIHSITSPSFTATSATAATCRRGCIAPISSSMFSAAPKRCRKTLERFKAEGRGVLVMLRDGAAGVPVVAIPKVRRDRLRRGTQPAVARGRSRCANSQAISASARSGC